MAAKRVKHPFKWPLRDGVQPTTFRDAKQTFERAYVEDLLAFTNGNVAAAARIADKERKDFYDLVNRAAVEPEDFRA